MSSIVKMMRSIAGDPFEPSNYAVHSRPFELAVIDFFARLWKIPKSDYWGYVR